MIEIISLFCTRLVTRLSLHIKQWTKPVTPTLVAGIIGVLLGQKWGYALYAVAGAIQLYINVFLWFFEREYVYPAVGPVAYYTYIWGDFVYWGAATLVYTLVRLNGAT